MPGVLIEDELKELLAKCENIVPEENYVVDECTKERDKEFELAKKSGVDLSQYESNEYTGFQLHEIRLGPESKVNVRLYDNIGFSWEQMRQIRKGLEEGVDGRTVTELVIEEKSGKDLPKLTGKFLAVRPDGVTYVAKKDGYIIFDETKYRIDIQDVLVIDGNINRLYGNVFYDGTVRVNGNIGEGAIISAKGDVIVTGYVQSSYISSGNKVVAIGGINTNDLGYICAQGGVYAGYAAATTRNMTEADIPMV